MKVFQEMGLTASEEKVYLALLDLGDSTRSDIVNKSGVSGSKVYDLLEKLQQKGLVSIYSKDKIKHFKPASPKQILNYLEEKKKRIIETEDEAKSLLPKLLEKFNSSKEFQEVELLSGIKGLEIIFREQVDMLKKGDICYVIGGTWGNRSSNESIVQAFFKKIHVMREKKNIKTKMLFNISQKDSTQKLYSKGEFPSTTTKYIAHTSPVAINIYKNKTVIIIFGDVISSIYITSDSVAKSFIEYFNLLWNSS